MTREEAIKIIDCYDIGFYDLSGAKIPADKLADAFDMAIEALQDKEDEPQFYTEDDYWNGMFAESEEAYKAWTWEEMGKTGDEINEINKEIIKDILKMMPTAYLLEALGVDTVDELMKPADAVHGWIPCSERLPEKGEVVLITNGKGNVRCGQYRSEHDVRDETHYWWWKGKTVETVLAWMPLPKPYREDGEA